MTENPIKRYSLPYDWDDMTPEEQWQYTKRRIRRKERRKYAVWAIISILAALLIIKTIKP